jgi:hypothetical protein
VDDPVRFFFDQHMPAGISRGLLRRGVDVLTAQAAGRCGLPDDQQFRFATSVGRVIVTFDTDYLALAAAALTAGESFAGVAWCPEKKYGYGELIQQLMSVHGVFTPDDMQNHVEYL